MNTLNWTSKQVMHSSTLAENAEMAPIELGVGGSEHLHAYGLHPCRLVQMHNTCLIHNLGEIFTGRCREWN